MSINCINHDNDEKFNYSNSYVEERSRWMVLQYADVLGYIPGIAIAIGMLRTLGGLFIGLGAVTIREVAAYQGNKSLAKKCDFVGQRAITEALRGLFVEVGTLGFGSFLSDRYRSPANDFVILNGKKHFECRESDAFACGSIFRVDSEGHMHYPREYLGKDGKPYPVKAMTEKAPLVGISSQDLDDNTFTL